MEDFIERLALRGAMIDEVLSPAFEVVPGQKADADRAARRLAAWCRSCASGDWEIFAKRLARDNLTLEVVLGRFATIRRRADAPPPEWTSDARWILDSLERPPSQALIERLRSFGEPIAFEIWLRPSLKQQTSAFGRRRLSTKSRCSPKARQMGFAIYSAKNSRNSVPLRCSIVFL